MTAKEIVAQAEQLPLDEQWMVVTELLRLLQMKTQAAVTDKRQAAPADDEFSAARMRGIIKPDGPIPTDDEIKEDYINYLVQKYS